MKQALMYLLSIWGFSGAISLSACSVDDAATSSVKQAEIDGWTPLTSEEHPPIHCEASSLVTKVQCTGSNCDNVALFCLPTPGIRTGLSHWTATFSDENTTQQICDPGFWVTGLSCAGRFCDNVSLECSEMANISQNDCHWTSSVSEEHGGLLEFRNLNTNTQYYTIGGRCSGGFCDNMSFFVCRF
jgi:hypothetical protein